MSLSLRIWPARYTTDEAFETLRELLSRYRPGVSELALIPSYSLDAFTPLDTVRQQSATLARRFEVLRADDYAVGINDISLGHMADASEWKGQPIGEPMVGHDGESAPGSLAPAHPDVLGYLSEKYAELAKSGPDFIWIDDDARIQQHPPAMWPDFSESSLAVFGERHDRSVDRVELLSLFEGRDAALWRHRWVSHLNELLQGVLRAIRDGVHGVDSRIELGLMGSGVRFNSYAQSDLNAWMAALGATRMRPGGGFYTDRTPADLFAKIVDCAEQTARLPSMTRTVDYEFETFPQQRGLKSVTMSLTECSSMIVNGMTAVTAHILKPEAGDLEDYSDWLDALSQAVPLWEMLREIGGNLPLRGYRSAISADWFEKRRARPWFPELGAATVEAARTGWQVQARLLELGVPYQYDDEEACGTILAGATIEGHSTEQLEAFLRGGVIMDSAALNHLEMVGLGHLTGVSTGKSYSNGVLERSTTHHLNGRFRGEERDARLGVFRSAAAVVLTPLSNDIEVLADLVTYSGGVLGPCLTLHRNELGGRIAVMGYSPWAYLDSTAKREQIFDLLDEITDDGMPVRMAARHLVPTLRRSSDGSRFLLHVVNASMDTSASTAARIRTIATDLVEILPNGARRSLDQHEYSSESGVLTIVTQPIAPWGFRVFSGSRAHA